MPFVYMNFLVFRFQARISFDDLVLLSMALSSIGAMFSYRIGLKYQSILA